MRLEYGFRMAANWPWLRKKTMMSRHNFPTWRHRQFFLRYRISLVKFSYSSKFHVDIVIVSGVMTIFVYKGLKDWPEFPKSEIPPSEFCPISRDLGELGIPNLTRMSLIKCYWILQNARVKAFTVSELLRETQQGGVVKLTPHPD